MSKFQHLWKHLHLLPGLDINPSLMEFGSFGEFRSLRSGIPGTNTWAVDNLWISGEFRSLREEGFRYS
jgi:hypothetical protein